MSDPNTPAKHPARPTTWTIVFAFAIIYTSWGTTYLAIKRGVKDEHLPPALFGGARVGLAGLLLLGYLAARGQSLRLARREVATVAVTGCILFVGGNGLITAAEKTVPSGVAAVLAATTPLWIGLLTVLWPGGERLSGRGWLGLVVGLAGVLLLLGPKLGDPADFVRDVGPLLVLGSALSWACGSLVMRHHRLEGSHLTAAGYQMAIGGGCLTLLGLVSGEASRLPEQVTVGAVGSFVYLLVVGSLVGFVAYNWLLGHVSAAKVSTYAYVNPAVAVLIGWADGEEMTVWLAGGIAVILAGVALVRGGGVKAGSTPLARPTPHTTEPRQEAPATADRPLPVGYDKE